MPDTYAIAGFSYTSDPVILFQSDSASACDQWRTGYIRFGDWGGYDALALFEIAPDQSAEAAARAPWRMTRDPLAVARDPACLPRGA
jgi:hypothetical protein